MSSFGPIFLFLGGLLVLPQATVIVDKFHVVRMEIRQWILTFMPMLARLRTPISAYVTEEEIILGIGLSTWIEKWKEESLVLFPPQNLNTPIKKFTRLSRRLTVSGRRWVQMYLISNL